MNSYWISYFSLLKIVINIEKDIYIYIYYGNDVVFYIHIDTY